MSKTAKEIEQWFFENTPYCKHTGKFWLDRDQVVLQLRSFLEDDIEMMVRRLYRNKFHNPEEEEDDNATR